MILLVDIVSKMPSGYVILSQDFLQDIKTCWMGIGGRPQRRLGIGDINTHTGDQLRFLETESTEKAE